MAGNVTTLSNVTGPATVPAANSTVVVWPTERPREGIVFDKWPLRLDKCVEYQDWILVAVSGIVLMLWCMPCICGQMRNTVAREFTKFIYTRLNVFFWTVTYLNLLIMMLTIGILPDWTVNEYVQYLVLFVSWILIHLKKMIISAAICVGFLWSSSSRPRFEMLLVWITSLSSTSIG